MIRGQLFVPKICFVTPEFPAVGGYGTYVYELSRRLATKGFEVHVLTGRLGPGEDSPPSVNVHSFYTTGTREFSFPAFEVQVNERLRRLNKKLAFDLIHSNSPMFLQTPLYTGNSNYLITAHGSVVDIAESVRPCFWRSHISEKLFLLGTPLFSLMERRALARSKRIIAVSRFVKSKLKEHHRTQDDRISVIHNGIDTSLFKPIRNPPADAESNFHRMTAGRQVILYVGRFYGVKNVETLLRAAPLIIREHPDALFLFRGAERKNRDYASQFMKDLNIPSNNYSFADYVPRKLLPRLYSAAHIFVMTSVYDPLPYSLLEAMSCETAAVATSVGGIPEILSHGSNGLLYKPGNHEELARLVCQLLEDENLRTRLCREARRTVEQQFSISEHLTRFIQVLDEIE